MTTEELFLKEGAYYFGNRLIYRNQDVGVTAPGTTLILNPDGEIVFKRLSDITDVEVKAARKPRAKAEEVLADPAFIAAA